LWAHHSSYLSLGPPVYFCLPLVGIYGTGTSLCLRSHWLGILYEDGDGRRTDFIVGVRVGILSHGRFGETGAGGLVVWRIDDDLYR
jgi:hypothetical protein